MEGLKPYICIHFTRTHWLSVAIFQTCPYCVCFPFHLFLMLFSTEGPLGFHLGLTFNLVKKNNTWFTNKFIRQPLWCLSVMILEHQKNGFLQDPLWKRQKLPTSGTPQGWLGTRLRERAHVPWRSPALQPPWSIRQSSSHWPRGSIFNFRLHPHPPHLFPSSIKHACLFSEGKTRRRWQLIEKQQFAFDKGVLWKWVYFEVWIF